MTTCFGPLGHLQAVQKIYTKYLGSYMQYCFSNFIKLKVAVNLPKKIIFFLYYLKMTKLAETRCND